MDRSRIPNPVVGAVQYANHVPGALLKYTLQTKPVV